MLGFRLVDGSITLLPALFVLVIMPDYFRPIREFASDYHATLNGKNTLTQVLEVLGCSAETVAKKESRTSGLQVDAPKLEPWQELSVLTFEHIGISYEGETALKDVSCSFGGFRKYGIVGPSGCGKTTLAQLLAGVVQPTHTIENDWFGNGKTVEQLESYFISQGKRLFVERMRHNHTIINEILPGQLLQKGDEVVLSGRREFAIGEEDWIGEEVIDPQLLDFPVEVLPVMIHKKPYANRKLEFIRKQPFMHGVSVRRIKRAGIDIPVFAQTMVDSGDTLELVGLKKEVETAAKQLGYIDRPTNATDMVFVGIGILIGGVIGALAIHIGGVPISLSTSGGALIAGLVFGWLRSKHPTFGQIPESSLWVLNNVGLNMFIAVVGISAGPSFIQGLKEVGPMLFIIGILATSLPLLLGLILARYVFHFHPALALGCTAGARTTTAALGAIQEAVDSETPSLGYTVTYAVGNTLLIIWGVVIILLM